MNEFVVIEETRLKHWKGTSDEDRVGKPFMPDYIYGALQKHRANSSVMGRQEDAEEYLGFLLDSLHEEFLAGGFLLSLFVISIEKYCLVLKSSAVERRPQERRP